MKIAMAFVIPPAVLGAATRLYQIELDIHVLVA
jgi:hypothetical protein